MTFKYRGISYQANLTTINTPQTKAEGKYRGQSYPLRQSAIEVLHSPTPMVYRGVSYNHKENVGTPQTIPQFIINLFSVGLNKKSPQENF